MKYPFAVNGNVAIHHCCSGRKDALGEMGPKDHNIQPSFKLSKHQRLVRRKGVSVLFTQHLDRQGGVKVPGQKLLLGNIRDMVRPQLFFRGPPLLIDGFSRQVLRALALQQVAQVRGVPRHADQRLDGRVRILDAPAMRLAARHFVAKKFFFVVVEVPLEKVFFCC